MRYVSELIETTISRIAGSLTVSTFGCGEFYYKTSDYKKGPDIPEIDETWEKWVAPSHLIGEMHVWVRRDESMYDDNIDDVLYDFDRNDISPKFDYHY